MKLILTSCFILIGVMLHSQNLTDFKIFKKDYHESISMSLFFSKSGISNSGAPIPSLHKITTITGGFEVKSTNFEKGGKNFHYHNKLYFDLVAGAVADLRNNKQTSGDESSTLLTTGLIGWMDVAWNVVASDKVAFAVGPNFNDYFFSSTYYIDTLEGGPGYRRKEPNGYYFAAGPTAILSYPIGNLFLLQAKYSYSFSYWRPISASSKFDYDKSVKKPHWSRLCIDLQSKWGLFAGFDYNNIINRTAIPNKTKRWDVLFGFRGCF